MYEIIMKILKFNKQNGVTTEISSGKRLEDKVMVTFIKGKHYVRCLFINDWFDNEELVNEKINSMLNDLRKAVKNEQESNDQDNNEA